MTRSTIMKSVFASIALACSLGASAQTVNQTVNVSVTFTPTCVLSSASAIAVNFGTYTAFQTTAATPATPPSFTINCSRNFGSATPTVGWDTTNGTAAGGGTVAGLAYTLSTGTPTINNGAAASGGTGATARTVVYTVGGTIAAGQAGDSTASATAARTLTVTY